MGAHSLPLVAWPLLAGALADAMARPLFAPEPAPAPEPTEGARERLEAAGFVFPEYRPDGRIETLELRRVPRMLADFARGRERAVVAAVERVR